MTDANEEGQTEELEAYRKLREDPAPALATLNHNLEDATAVFALPPKYRCRLRTTNMIDRLIEEARHREKVIRIFPNQESVYRLVGARCTKARDERSTGQRYLKVDDYFEWKTAQKKDQLPTAQRSEPVAVSA